MNRKWLWDRLGVVKIGKDWHRSLARVGGGRGQLAGWFRGWEAAGEAGGWSRGHMRTRGWWPAAVRGQRERRGGVIRDWRGETQFRVRRRGRVAVSHRHPGCGTRGEVWGEIVKIVVSGGHEVLLGRGQLRKVVKSGLEKVVWTRIKNSIEVSLRKRIIKRTFPIHWTSSVEIISIGMIMLVH